MVLIVNRRRKDAAAVSEMFHFMGILSYAATPSDALSEISLLYRAVIVMEPQTLPDALDFVTKLRSYARAVPIFAISDGIDDFKYKDIFDGCYKFSIYSSTLAHGIADYCKAKRLPTIGDYRVAGINASADHIHVTHFDKLIPYTKTEAMILRLLIRAYPLPLSSDKILKYAFRPSRSPEAASIRTHISSMNKKSRNVRERNVILSIPSKGYTLLTPETVRELDNIDNTDAT